MAEEKDKTEPASPQEVAAAVQEGATVPVQLPENTTGVSFEGKSYVANELGVVMLNIRHALHAVEAFGATIISEVEAEVEKVIKPKKK